MKKEFESGRIEIRRTARTSLPYGASVQDYIEMLQQEADSLGAETSKIFIDFSYEMGYYNNPDLYVELQWMSPEIDKEYNKRIDAEKKKNLLDAEKKRKSQAAEEALYLKLKKKYE